MRERDWTKNWSTGEVKTYKWLLTKEWLLAKAHLQALLHSWDDELFDLIGKQIEDFISLMDEYFFL
jgi:hypothetical protein